MMPLSAARGCCAYTDLDELFAAAETLGHLKPFSGKRLAILTNGGGVGVLAVDRLMDLGGTLAGISAGTIKRLDAVLPPIWSKANPVDIAGDADATRYARGARGTARRSGQRRDPGHERADRARLGCRCRPFGGGGGAKSIATASSPGSRSSASGSAMTAPFRSASTLPVFRTTQPNPTPFAASCTSCTIARRSML